MLLKNRFVQSLGGGRLEQVGTGLVSFLQRQSLGAHKSPEKIAMIKKMRRDVRGGPLTNEAFLLHSLAKAQSKLAGDFAEVGVFRGGSARMLCEGKGDKALHLFDTFAGLPEGTDIDGGVFRPAQYACSKDRVQAYLKDCKNVHYHQGLFPDSVIDDEEIKQKKFALAHFDVDLYEGTKACLEFFYPRMVPGGILISHDYSILDGVSEAFHEFLADKPEWLIDIPTTQCMIVKLP
ncbi:Macrocin O-methyltransferase [Rosistilla ulvae]|uniref:Macrocin O-methyltransferase n=1 Tax=Rosistilla ulvae TaxID=1930277 RepID=A0A517LYS8_9BACT|nr:TylF/MycF/NovP-related O-methyltransferase [Rosistilla ulvae]QDS87771.1 Macrocin O-methyltransferase [Rosistilla ulvae]